MLGAVRTSVFSTPCFHNHVGVLSCVFGSQQLINNQLTVIVSSHGCMCLWCPDQSSTTDAVQVIWWTPRLDDQLDVGQHRYKGYVVDAVGARSLRESAWTFRGRWWQLEESKDVWDKVCQHRTALGDVDGVIYYDSCNGTIVIEQLNGDKLAGALSLKEGWMWQIWTCI